MTPASSVGRETPPPPPSSSLFDTPGLQKNAMIVDAPMEQRDETVYMSTSPIVGQENADVVRKQKQTVSSMMMMPRQPSVQDYESTWVTIYGFQQDDLPIVLREFAKCGDIVEFGSFDDGPYVNWVHICFSNKHAAQRALLRSGQQLSPTCMVGVKELDDKKRVALQQRVDGTGHPAGRRPLPPVTKSQTEQQGKKCITSEKVVPLDSSSIWDKVCEFVLGI